jgi:hypothetical protein
LVGLQIRMSMHSVGIFTGTAKIPRGQIRMSINLGEIQHHAIINTYNDNIILM